MRAKKYVEKFEARCRARGFDFAYDELVGGLAAELRYLRGVRRISTPSGTNGLYREHQDKCAAIIRALPYLERSAFVQVSWERFRNQPQQLTEEDKELVELLERGWPRIHHGFRYPWTI